MTDVRKTPLSDLPKVLTDAEVVDIIDELIFVLKGAHGPVGLSLRTQLRNLVRDEGLDGDPHRFASLPVED